MVKFGDQLEIGRHGPWREYYLNYIKLKRLIERRKFVLDKLKDEKEVSFFYISRLFSWFLHRFTVNLLSLTRFVMFVLTFYLLV